MKDQFEPTIISDENENITRIILPAEARDTSKANWLGQAALLAGTVTAGSLISKVGAQDAAPPASTDSLPTSMPSPTGSQAVENASIVANKKSNPNNPANTIPGAAKSAAPSDVEILNFALGLEYLEAEYYASIVAANGRRQYLTARQAEVAQKLANDESAHVSAILEILSIAGATPVAKPTFKFPDNVYISNVAFLTLATAFEETGVGAYLGAAPKVKSKDALRFAASVYGIECRHTGLIRMLSGQFFSDTETEVPLTVEQVKARVAPYIVG